MGGYRVTDEKLFKSFRVVGAVVDQGFDKETVFDPDFFISGNQDLKILILEYTPLFLELVSPDVAFV